MMASMTNRAAERLTAKVMSAGSWEEQVEILDAALAVERIVPDAVPAHVIDMEATFLAHTERASGEAALRVREVMG